MLRMAVGTILSVLAMSGAACRSTMPELDPEPQILITSLAWQRTVTPEIFEARRTTLLARLEDLREGTASAWVGRQDDATGYLTELYGGRFRAAEGTTGEDVIASFMTAFGLDLFGVGAHEVTFREGDPAGNNLSFRGRQRIDEIPVLDGALTASVDRSAAALTSLRGRVFPGLLVETEPLLTADKAKRIALRVSGGTTAEDPRLVVVPTAPAGALAWEVSIRGTPEGEFELDAYYIDAARGDVLLVRPNAIIDF